MALKISTEMNEGIRYKLRMMGVPIDGPTNCFCDNKSVVTNVSKPDSTLNKKHNAIAYHKVRESVAQGTQRVTHEKGVNNLSDCLTKFLGPLSFRHCVECILFHKGFIAILKGCNFIRDDGVLTRTKLRGLF